MNNLRRDPSKGYTNYEGKGYISAPITKELMLCSLPDNRIRTVGVAHLLKLREVQGFLFDKSVGHFVEEFTVVHKRLHCGSVSTLHKFLHLVVNLLLGGF